MIIFRVKNGQLVAEVDGVVGPVCETKLQELLQKTGLQSDGEPERKSEFYQGETVRAEIKVV